MPKIGKDVVLNPFRPLIFNVDSIKLGITVIMARKVDPIDVKRFIVRFK